MNKTTTKEMQKLVILNTAKINKVNVEEYIGQVLGEQKPIDDLTKKERNLTIKYGLTFDNFR